MKGLFDQSAKDKEIQVGDLVLQWDVGRSEKGKHREFDPLYFFPFRVVEVKRNNTFVLENLEGDTLKISVNGQFLKPYF